MAEHQPLVARALVLVPGGVDADRDILGLGMQVDLDFGMVVMEAVLGIADILHGGAGQGFDLFLVHFAIGHDAFRTAHFAGNHDPVRRRQRFARDAGAGIGGQEQIDDFVGNAIADLVWVAFGYGFTREQERIGHTGSPP